METLARFLRFHASLRLRFGSPLRPADSTTRTGDGVNKRRRNCRRLLLGQCIEKVFCRGKVQPLCMVVKAVVFA